MAKKKAKKKKATGPKKYSTEWWVSEANRELGGRRIVSVRWLSKGEVDGLGWDQKAIVIQLDDGTILYPSRDDEGNGAGALFVQGPGNHNTWPTLRV